MRHALLITSLLISCSHEPAKNTTDPGQPGKENTAKDRKLVDSLKEKPGLKKRDTTPTCESLFDSVGKCLIPAHENVYNIPVKNAPTKGATKPLVTIVEFSDLECPGCRYWALNTFPAVLRKHKGDVAVVFRHFPLSFHPLAPMAAQALCAVRAKKGDTAFWKVHDFLYTNQQSMTFEFLLAKPPKGSKTSKDPILAQFVALLKGLGIDPVAYRRSLLLETYKKVVEADVAFGNSISVNQTPQVFVNGRLLENHEQLEDAVEREIKRAKKLMADGVKRENLLSHIAGKGSPILKLPIPEKTIRTRLTKLRPTFLTQCKTSEKLKPLVEIMKKCNAIHVRCPAFTRCVNERMKELASSGGRN